MTVRAVDSTESPVEEYDLRGQVLTPAEILGTGQRISFRRCVL